MNCGWEREEHGSSLHLEGGHLGRQSGYVGQLCFGGIDDDIPMAPLGRKECPIRDWKWSSDIR